MLPIAGDLQDSIGHAQSLRLSFGNETDVGVAAGDDDPSMSSQADRPQPAMSSRGPAARGIRSERISPPREQSGLGHRLGFGVLVEGIALFELHLGGVSHGEHTPR